MEAADKNKAAGKISAERSSNKKLAVKAPKRENDTVVKIFPESKSRNQVVFEERNKECF